MNFRSRSERPTLSAAENCTASPSEPRAKMANFAPSNGTPSCACKIQTAAIRIDDSKIYNAVSACDPMASAMPPIEGPALMNEQLADSLPSVFDDGDLYDLVLKDFPYGLD